MQRIQYHEYGGPEVMRLEDFTPDAPGKGEVAVAVRYAAINPIDWKIRDGMMRIMTGRSFPRGMGMDLSGVVTAIGQGVTRFDVGDPVFGLARFKQTGALGESALAKEVALARKPDEVSFEDAACLGTPGVTAWNGLIDKAKLNAGQSVFINGCAGAVGEAAAQIARMSGAHVSGSCGADAMDRARSLGMLKVYDYRVTDPAKIAEDFDVVFDAAATLSTASGVGMLRKGGTYTTVDPTPARFLRAMLDRRVRPIVATPRADLLDMLAHAARDDGFRLPIARIVPLAEAIALIAAIEGGQKLRGKAVVAIG
ncbi:NAD(P)-dependent alcohol dehydrogenase [Sphingomonas sp. PP-CC-3G-468]|uniref:NAD(P)-dependent alcohol dehydrogenase n=1 Tax=Sphingomonas sp. PP-CC-3G-468 TaxID=2135656 RepID=UPI00104D722D|nr:NAD(P)-dependent alcohol dehydrogenase [Sphingomonas sp. PP-CC-3G-468]TCM07394.1 NADPH:quinone reductase-like Zn-dependent oxidoreductase [Sphingomonas sp. PP-CC-3G-468]